MVLEEKLLHAVDGGWIADRAEELVRLPSVTMDEVEVCRLFEAQMRDLGLEVDVRPVTAGRNNLYACIRGAGGGPALNLNGHLDTIPTGLCPPCRREGDRLYGRGSTDMKGGMAAMLGAAKALLESGLRLKGDLWLTAVVGHEETEAQKDGPRAFVDDLNEGRVGGDRVLIVEGRDALWVMSMGSMVFTVEMHSDLGGRHTQYVPFSQNPVRYMGQAIDRLHVLQEELDRGEAHPLAGAERVDVGQAHAGDYFNRTAPSAVLQGTRRWMPGRRAEDVRAELEDILRPIAAEGRLQLEVRMEHQREPFETAVDDAAVVAVARAHHRVSGKDAEHVGLRIVGDANIYVHGSGVPTFYYGPSNETAHADVEWVSLERMEKAAQVYALAAAEYCGMAD